MASIQINPNRPLPLQNALGAARDKTNDFLTIKNRIILQREPSKRFQPKTNVISYNETNLDSTHQSNKQAFSTRSSSQVSLQHDSKLKGNKYVKMNDEVGHGKNELPPLWVDIQESIDDKIKDVDIQFEQLKSLRQQRFKPKFNEDEDHRLDIQINDLVSSLTNTIKTCEKELRNMMNEQFENDSDQQIRKNIQQSFVCKLQEITRQLRIMEKEHLLKVKNLYGEEGEIYLNEIESKENDFYADLDQKVVQKNKDLIQLEQIEDQQKLRSTDIDRMVNQINDLAVLFKDLSNIVVEQGTILDRIDYNIQNARKYVHKGNVELEKTLKRETSWRAKGCMGCLTTSIIIFTVLLVMKHIS